MGTGTVFLPVYTRLSKKKKKKLFVTNYTPTRVFLHLLHHRLLLFSVSPSSLFVTVRSTTTIYFFPSVVFTALASGSPASTAERLHQSIRLFDSQLRNDVVSYRICVHRRRERNLNMNPSTSSSGKQLSLRRSLSTPSLCSGEATVAEFCGGTTAGCAALCCCGPCGVVKLVVLAVYKLPRGICRRAIRRQRRRRLAKKRALENRDFEKMMSKAGSSQFAIHPLESRDDDDRIDKSFEEEEEEEEEDEAVIALEKEMWNRFYSGGFWRSVSQAETASSQKTD